MGREARSSHLLLKGGIMHSDGNLQKAIGPLLITVDQVAELLQVSSRTVWRLRSKGDLPAPLRVAGGIRWRLFEIQAWIDAGCPLKQRVL